MTSPRNRPSGRGGHYRLVVLGAGAEALAAAQTAAERDVRVAVVVPEIDRPRAPQTLLGDKIREIQRQTGLDVDVHIAPDWGIDVFRGQPWFSRYRSLAVGRVELTYRSVLVATGWRRTSFGERVSQAELCLRPETATEMTELPKRLAVVGDGAEACIWAQAMSRLGSQVDWFTTTDDLLSGEDAEAVARVGARLRDQGVKRHVGWGRLHVDRTGRLLGVVVEHPNNSEHLSNNEKPDNGERTSHKEKLLVDAVLLCEPRVPNLGGLALPTAAVRSTPEGIEVDEHLATTGTRVFAAGAACGIVWQQPEAALATARLATHNALCRIAWRRRSLDNLVVPRTTPTDPLIIRIGPLPGTPTRKRRLEKQGDDVEEVAFDVAECQSSSSGETHEGFVKLHISRRSSRLCEATLVGHTAEQFAALLTLAMTHHVPMRMLADLPLCAASSTTRLIEAIRRG